MGLWPDLLASYLHAIAMALCVERERDHELPFSPLLVHFRVERNTRREQDNEREREKERKRERESKIMKHLLSLWNKF